MKLTMICLVLVSGAAVAACGKKTPPPTETPDAAVVAVADTAATTPPPTTEPTKAPAPEDAGAPPTTAADDAGAPATAAASDAAPPAADDAAAPTVEADGGAIAVEDAAAAAPDGEGDGTVAAADGGPGTLSGPPKPFDDMSIDEQKTYMKETILPAMRERFQKFDPKEFAKVNCATCHGKNPQDRKFEMPNSALTKLPATREGWDELAKEEPEALEFMGKVVVPAMAAMLGEEPFDPKTQKGFGCFECHTKK